MMKLSLRYSKLVVRYFAVQKDGSLNEANLDRFSFKFWILNSGS